MSITSIFDSLVPDYPDEMKREKRCLDRYDSEVFFFSRCSFGCKDPWAVALSGALYDS